MGGAHDGNDDIQFYHAAIEHTFEAAIGAGGLTQVPTDLEGALPPGRYLAQALITGAGVMWLHVGKFDTAVPLAPSAPTGAGVRRIPLSSKCACAIEFNVVKGHNDRIAAQMSTGAGTLFVTRVSRTGRID
jgi:hypothetical protein